MLDWNAWEKESLAYVYLALVCMHIKQSNLECVIDFFSSMRLMPRLQILAAPWQNLDNDVGTGHAPSPLLYILKPRKL